MANKIIPQYFGGKNGEGVAQRIINQIRPHDCYAELFGGSGAVLQMKKPATYNHFNELDSAIFRRWKELSPELAIPNFQLTSVCAIRLLKYYHFHPNLKYCFYLDPPYPLNSRRSAKKVYKFEMSDAQHCELLDVVTKLPKNVDVLLSTYENPMYAEALSAWRCHTFSGRTRRGPTTEFLYMNYRNEEAHLHQYDFLGENYVDRQRIRRKIAGKIQQLRQLPAAERQAIITAIKELA